MARQTFVIDVGGFSWTGSMPVDADLTEDGAEGNVLTFVGFTAQAVLFRTSINLSQLVLNYENGLIFATDTYEWTASPPGEFASTQYFLFAFGDYDASEFTNHTVTITIDDGTATEDGPWSEPLGLLTADGPWSAILSGLDSTDGPWSNFVSEVTTHGLWSTPLGLLTQDGPWSDFVSSATSDGPWSTLIFTTIDGPWSIPLVTNETLDGPWSDIIGGLDTIDGPWSNPRRSYVTIQTGVAVLNTPEIIEDTLTEDEDTPGNYSLDLTWMGKEEHHALHQVRIRWISRASGIGIPPYNDAGEWPETQTVETMDNFEYLDRVIADPDMVTSGMVTLLDQMLEQIGWAGRPLWVMARLEVEDNNT